MNRRGFIKNIGRAVAVTVAGYYVPSKVWEIKNPLTGQDILLRLNDPNPLYRQFTTFPMKLKEWGGFFTTLDVVDGIQKTTDEPGSSGS